MLRSPLRRGQATGGRGRKNEPVEWAKSPGGISECCRGISETHRNSGPAEGRLETQRTRERSPRLPRAPSHDYFGTCDARGRTRPQGRCPR